MKNHIKILIVLFSFFSILNCSTDDRKIKRKRTYTAVPEPLGTTPKDENAVAEKEADDAKNDELGESGKTEENNNSTEEKPDNTVIVDEPQGTPVYFNIIMSQTYMPCASCGIWFDWQNNQEYKPKLVIDYTVQGQTKSLVLQEGLNGMKNAYSIGSSPNKPHDGVMHKMLVKGGHSFGYFCADIQEIPKGATINKAMLSLTLEKHEGMSNDDTTTVITVYEYSKPWSSASDFKGGTQGEKIREIRAKEDMWAQGMQKFLRPTGSFEFTDYVKKIQQNRK